QRLPRQPGGVGDLTQVGHGRNDRREDQRWNDRPQQSDEGGSDRRQRRGEPVRGLLSVRIHRGPDGECEPTEKESKDEAEDDLGSEGGTPYAPTRPSRR